MDQDNCSVQNGNNWEVQYFSDGSETVILSSPRAPSQPDVCESPDADAIEPTSDGEFLVSPDSSCSLPSVSGIIKQSASAPDIAIDTHMSESSNDSIVPYPPSAQRKFMQSKTLQDSQTFSDTSCDSWTSLPSLPETQRYNAEEQNGPFNSSNLSHGTTKDMFSISEEDSNDASSVISSNSNIFPWTGCRPSQMPVHGHSPDGSVSGDSAVTIRYGGQQSFAFSQRRPSIHVSSYTSEPIVVDYYTEGSISGDSSLNIIGSQAESFIFPFQGEDSVSISTRRKRPGSDMNASNSSDGSSSSVSILSPRIGKQSFLTIQDGEDMYEPDEDWILSLKTDPYAPGNSCIKSYRVQQRKKKRRQELPKEFGKCMLDYMDLAAESPSMEHMAVSLFYDNLSYDERVQRLYVAYHGQTDKRLASIYQKIIAFYDTEDLTASEIFLRVRKALLISNRVQVRQDKFRRECFARQRNIKLEAPDIV